MENPINKKLLIYSSIFIASVISLPRLLRVAHNDLNRYSIISFNIAEWGINYLLLFTFSIYIFKLNVKKIVLFYSNERINFYFKLIAQNFLILLVFAIIGSFIGKIFIRHTPLPMNGNLLRYAMAQFLTLVEIKIIAIKQQADLKNKENEQLRYTNTKMELELLKSQLNPHFLFNALSSLSGTIYENPNKAQRYIVQLSNYFRYSLHKSDREMSTVKEELESIQNYSGLLSMRFEEGFKLSINVDAAYYERPIPHISLQPLLENALKHNIATAQQPLTFNIYTQQNSLIISNNIQLKAFPEPGTNTGLANLSERYHLLMNKHIEIYKDNGQFVIQLPL